MSVFGVETFTKTFNMVSITDLITGEQKQIDESTVTIDSVLDDSVVEQDEGTITDDSTEEEPVDSSGDGESSTVEEEEQQDDEEEDEEDDSAIGGGGSYEDTDSDLIQGVIGDGISSAVGGFFSKALIGVGVILGAGYAYENREKIANYFKNMS